MASAAAIAVATESGLMVIRICVKALLVKNASRQDSQKPTDRAVDSTRPLSPCLLPHL
jgi:hypothetical protein